MALVKLEDFYPNYRQKVLGGKDIKNFDVYAGKTDEKIGTVSDDVVDLTGRFRYLVIDTSDWGVHKKILLPVGCCRLDCPGRRVYALSLLNKKNVEELPEYTDGIIVDYSYEDRVSKANFSPADFTLSAGEQAESLADNHTESLSESDERDSQTLQLYEERLIAKKSCQQTGEVIVSKRIEIETAQVSIPVRKERVIIERTTPADAGRVIEAGEVVFREGEVARLKIYEETADIRKEVFLREQVTIRKQVECDTVDAQASLRREELDVNTEKLSEVEKTS